MLGEQTKNRYIRSKEWSLNFIFIDAENIGLKETEQINTTIFDKVLVFSRSEAIKIVCEKNLFIFVSSYPTGNNQADFYIIGSLSKIINSLKIEQKNNCDFILYSRDSALATAFSFQCNLHKVKHKIKIKPTNNVVQTKQEKLLEQKILEYLKKPTESESVRNALSIPKPDFTRIINSLIINNKIQRSSDKKKWVKV